jgi:hypothetical protein
MELPGNTGRSPSAFAFDWQTDLSANKDALGTLGVIINAQFHLLHSKT